MILPQLYWEFFLTGLFSVGGGLATVPFLSDLSLRTGWFTQAQLADMIAVSESTPGSIGINMATYTGYLAAGIPGSLVATLGLVTPSVLVILLIAGFLEKFRASSTVDAVFYGLRPASVALIAGVGISVARFSLFSPLNPPAVVLSLAVLVCLQVRPLSRLHPLLYIALSAVAGILLRL